MREIRTKLKSRVGKSPLYKTLNGLKSLRRFSKVQRTCTYTNQYGIRDYKKKKLHPIEFVSRGRWKFYNKHFNKLADINHRHIPKN